MPKPPRSRPVSTAFRAFVMLASLAAWSVVIALLAAIGVLTAAKSRPTWNLKVILDSERRRARRASSPRSPGIATG